MRSVLYLRKSRADADAEARGEGETLARHERILLEVAKKMQLQVLDIYREIVSGETIAARPIMQKLLQEVESGVWEAVLVVEVERLARGATLDQGIMAQAFKYSNTKIITPIKVHDPNNEHDEEYFEFSLFMSRREYKTINRRMQMGRMGAIKEGKYITSIPPYGYNKVPMKGNKGYTLESNPEQAETIKLIFDLYTRADNREGVSLIVRHLNSLNIKPLKGDVWVTASIRDILSNPVYIGKLRWNWRKEVKRVVDGKIEKSRPRNINVDLFDGIHEPIITQEIFDLAQEYLKNNKTHPCPKDMPIMNPLAGIVTCGLCGRNMVRRPYANRNQQDTLMCPVTSCTNVSSPLPLVEQAILEQLKQMTEGYVVEPKKKTSTNNISFLRKSIIAIEKEIDTLKKQLNKSYELLEQGIYDTDTFLTRTNLLTANIKEGQTKLESTKLDIEKIIVEENKKLTVIPDIKKVIDSYSSAETAQEKNDLMKIVLHNVSYVKLKKGVKNSPIAPFCLTLTPKIPL